MSGDEPVDRETYRTLVERATDPLYAVGADGTFAAVNEEFETLTGYDRETLLGMEPATLLHEEDSDEWNRRVQLLRGDESPESECWVGRIVSKHGTEIPVEWVVSLRSPESDGRCVVGRATDTREQSRQRQKRDVLDRSLRHNIRNQMNIILSKATTLQDIEDDGYRTAAEQIERIGEDIINISNKARKAQQHIGVPADEECRRNLVDEVETAVAKFDIKHPGISVETDLPDTARARIPPALDSALVELLENAAIHHPSGSGPVFVDISTTEDSVVLRVRDECPPIPDQVRETLGRGVHKPLQHSDGLGLWIVQWAVDSVGGTLSFDRRDDDEGNVVSLTFDRID